MDNNSSMIKITFFHQSDVKTIITITNVYIEDITRWREDMNFIFEWQNYILRTSAASE